MQGVEMNKWPEERCIKQFVLNAERNVKFRSNLTEADQYTAKNAIQNEDHQEDTNLAISIHSLFTIFHFPIFSTCICH
jgi:hypothetical protein